MLNNAQPYISIILPVYNGERFLHNSICSILSQDFTDYEIIIWDDCSTDSSAIIIDSYARQDSRITNFRNEKNVGLFKSLNMSIAHTRGELLRLWCQDDVMKSHCLSTEVEFHKQYPHIGMSYCAYDVIDESGKTVVPASYDKNTPVIISPSLAAQIMFYHGSITGNIANVMVKKRIFDTYGLFREDMSVAADFEMWVRISSQYPLGYIRSSLMCLRIHAGQFSKREDIALVFMKEEYEIYRMLIRRLPGELVPYAKTYSRWHRYIQYTNYMLRYLRCGKVAFAINSFKKIREEDNPFLLIGIWAVSANGRFFIKKPKYVCVSNETLTDG